MIAFNNVKRRTARAYNVLYSGARNSRPIVVELGPDDCITFRELGRRGRFLLPAEGAFKYAVRLAALQAARERKAMKRGRA